VCFFEDQESDNCAAGEYLPGRGNSRCMLREEEPQAALFRSVLVEIVQLKVLVATKSINDRLDVLDRRHLNYDRIAR